MKKIKAKELNVNNVIIIKDVHYIITMTYLPHNRWQTIVTDDGLERKFPEDFLVNMID